MARLAISGTDGGAPLLLLLALLPFEPREPTLSVPGMQLTLLEIAALLLVPWIAWSNRRELLRLVGRPPLPLVFLGAFASCHLLSAALAEAPRFLPLKASLRMLACAGFAFVVAALGRERQRRALRGLAWGTLCVALLAVIEGAGFGGLDALLDAFREGAVFVGGTRRASAGSEHPNLAAAFLASGLVIWSGLTSTGGRSLLAVAVLTLGLLLTYSRGGLVAALISLCALLLARAVAGLSLRTVVGTLSLIGLASSAFALRSEAFRLRLLGEPAAGWFVARYRPETARLQLAPGESVPLAIELENRGKASWRAAHGMALGQRWFDLGTAEIRGGPATTLPSDVEPGHRLKLVVPLTAPGLPGRYRVLLDLTHDNRRWLSEAGVAPGSVDVLVGTTQEADVPASSARLPQAVLPNYRQPDRAEYSGWALAMWRERPWTGVGSGNFRW